MPRNRSLPPHLETRRSGYVWRRRLPRSLQDRNPAHAAGRENSEEDNARGKKFLCLSLRTHVRTDAKILARRITAMSDLAFAAGPETTMAIAPEIQASLLETLARFEIEAFERARAIADPRSPEAAAWELRREEALQATLRRALHLGDRTAARDPLRHVAAHLGLVLEETDPDWKMLAHEATRVLLDISQERLRRQQGVYGQPTVFFRRAVGTADAVAMPQRIAPADITVPPAAFATGTAISTPAAPAPTPIATDGRAASQESSPDVTPASEPDRQRDAAATPADPARASGLETSTALTQVIVPVGLDCPDGLDVESWQHARIAARPPRILIDRQLLTEASRSALDKQRGITLSEAIELYFELLSWGYRAPFAAHQKRKIIPEKLRTATVEERLCEDHKGKRRLALDYWPAALGDEPVDEISVDDVNDALQRFWGVPANHGKSGKNRGDFSLVEQIEQADARKAQLDRDIAAAEARGAPAEEIDRMRLNGHEPGISVTTYIKHGRVMRAVGEMLMDVQLIDQNPFSICTWSNKDEKALKGSGGDRKREAWDDRIHELFGSRIFREPLADIGEPLFWAPLIARHQGLRSEEILQLSPDDFGTDKGIPYLRIRHTIVNGLKTLSSARTLPIHPQLIELGLLKLVELRKAQGHIRLFPFLNRGKQKGTFSANFSKAFGYYRRTNDCYWPGLDFHALRTTFHHDLLGDDKSDAIRCRLMGHTYTDEGDRSYGQNLGIEKLARRLESVVVDISMIRRPFEDGSGSVTARAAERGLRVVGAG